MKQTKTQPLPDLARTRLILNFGHPLSDRAKAEITARFGPVTVAWVRVQLDINAPVSEQVVKICREAVAAYGSPDYIILPGLALAAVYVDRYFSRAEDDFPPCVTYVPIIRLVMVANSIPPVYTFGGVE